MLAFYRFAATQFKQTTAHHVQLSRTETATNSFSRFLFLALLLQCLPTHFTKLDFNWIFKLRTKILRDELQKLSHKILLLTQLPFYASAYFFLNVQFLK